MQPEFAPLGSCVDGLRGAHEEPLEDIGQMSHSELIVEVDSSLAEGARHTIMQSKCCLQDLDPQLLNVFTKFLQVALHTKGNSVSQEGHLNFCRAALLKFPG